MSAFLQYNQPILLASASPRRSEILRQIGVQFRVVPHGIEEIRKAGENPQNFVLRMAQEKARSALDQNNDGQYLVLAADTAVLWQQELLGKPLDRDDYCSMLKRLSGCQHKVLTAVCAVDSTSVQVGFSQSEVVFRELDDEEIAQYWETGEPVGKAGGYAIQGYGAVFITALKGSYSGVMGLPVFETSQLLRSFGIPLWVPAESTANE